MGFMNADLPDVDLETFGERPHLERMKILSRHSTGSYTTPK